MLRNRRNLVLGFTALVALGACTQVNNQPGQFWQRVHVADAIYQQGPKAQQMLNKDISQCVTELRELESLGSLKNAIPVDREGRTLNPDEQALYDWDTPQRKKHLLDEQMNYTDFETCMAYKGWERVQHVPYDVSRKGRDNYLRHHLDKDYIPAEYAPAPTEGFNADDNTGRAGLNE